MKLRLMILFFLIYPSCVLLAQRDLETIKSEEELKQFIYLTAPQPDAFVAVQRLAKPYIDKKDWDGAIKVFMNFRDRFIEDIDRTDKIVDLLRAQSQKLEIINIKKINTSNSEYCPSLAI